MVRLLAAGVNIEQPLENGVTPFYLACQNGHQEVVKRLLAAGANINAPSNDGVSPLFMACQNDHLEVVKRLLAAGANIDAPNKNGTTPLFMACQNGHQEVVERLLAAGSNTVTPRNDGITPLFMACENGHQEVVERLLAAGVNINPKKGFFGFLFGTRNPIDIARDQNHTAIVSLLSQPLPEAVVATHRHRIQDIKTRYLRDKQRSQLDLAERLLLQKEAELIDARKREAQLRVEQDQMNDVMRRAELSNFNVEQSQLDVDAVPFAKGGNGLIHQGRYHGTVVAVKCLSEGVPELYKMEVRMWCRLRHPNVLQLLGLSLDISRPMIVMELMEGSLFDVLHNSKVLLGWGRRVEMAHGIAAGLSYIHAQGAVHRDIKSLNVLVRGREVKIADFGSARGLESLQHTPKNPAGTMAYLAPELFDNAPPTAKVDLYAFGVVMCELASREIPWAGCTPAAITKSVVAEVRPHVDLNILKEAAGPEFVDLMQRCWKQKAEDRPTSTEVLKELTTILGVSSSPIPSSATSPAASSSPATPQKPFLLPDYGNVNDGSFPIQAAPNTPVTPLAACSSTDWSVEEWLASLGLSKYIPIFREHELFTPELIKRLSLIELKEEIGIAAYGARKQIFDAAKLL